MAEISLPDMSLQWAESGDVLQPSNAKIQSGWDAEVPPRQWFNWLDNRQDAAIAHIVQHGIAQWSATIEYQANKSYVVGSDGIVYNCVITNTNINPVGDLTGSWKVAFPSFINSQIASIAAASTVNLTTGAPNTSQIVISGQGIAISNFTVAANRMFFVRFSGANTLVNSASLVTNTGGNIITFAGMTIAIRATATNTVEVLYADRFASNAETQVGTAIDRAVTPAGLTSVFTGTNVSLAENGYQKLPSGLIIQWAATGIIGNLATSATANRTVTFPIAFPNRGLTYWASISSQDAPNSSGITTGCYNLTTTQMSVVATNLGSTTKNISNILCFAIGY